MRNDYAYSTIIYALLRNITHVMQLLRNITHVTQCYAALRRFTHDTQIYAGLHNITHVTHVTHDYADLRMLHNQYAMITQ